MCVARKIHFKKSFQTIFLVAGILLSKINCVQQNKHDVIGGGIANANFFRFQSFEPRGILLQQQTYANETFTPNKNSTISRHEHKQFRDTFGGVSPPKREGRGFYFQTTDEDITVETEFIIPFVRVPIVWSSNFMRASMRKLLNLHTGALLWSGAFVVVGAIVAGLVNAVIAVKPALNTALYGRRNKETRGLADTEEFWSEDSIWNRANPTNMAYVLDATLHEYDIDLKSCVQRSICHYIKKSENEVRCGDGSSSQKILVGVLRAQNLRQFMLGTAVFSAIEAGQNLSCENLERRCKLPTFGRNGFIRLVKNYLKTP